MGKIDIRGVEHSYQLTATTAADVVLVFIHGWLLSQQYWQPVVQQLAPQFQCLSYDLRGFGRSRAIALDPTNLGYTPLAYAQDLQILLTELNVKRVWLIGHSLGATVALWGANQLPDTVEGVICVNAGGGIYLQEEFDKFRAIGQRLVKLRPQWLANFPGMAMLMARSAVVNPIAIEWGQQRIIDFVSAHPDAALRSLLDSTTEAEVNRLPRLVAQLQQPVYFISGANDPVMQPQYVRHLASYHALFQDCGENVIEIPDCGHLAMVEHPNTVATHITQLLTQHHPLPTKPIPQPIPVGIGNDDHRRS